MSKGKVLVAMSGGLDSSVVAMMLHNEGYEVVGVTMKTWDYASAGGSTKTTGCCSLDDINDARQMAVDFGFPHMIIDIREEFGDYIIDNFVDEYVAGRTPNPCVLCNTHIKWDALLKRADQLDCEFIATGHYAQVREENGRYIVSKGVDQTKDQSYVLWGLSQENLARTIFPLGKMHKKDIRQVALDSGYESIAKKSESYEICFIPDNDYRGFLKRRVKGLEEEVDGGLFVDKEGKVLGKHRGYPFYTIGQRRGLELALGEPMYVTGIHPDTNTVTLGLAEDLLKTRMSVRGLNLIKYAELPETMEAMVKVRYKHPGSKALVEQRNGDLTVNFYEEVSAIAPGQSAVFYEGDDVIGGGFIKKDH
ncbi:MAG: tRNA-specific 2-thiouridylase [Bacteroidia bacterium]|jgi:tRNA-specific 2-thiouridylase